MVIDHIEQETTTYIARLIWAGGVHQTLEFEARSDAEAWEKAHNHPVVDPLRGIWVDVQRKPNPQQQLEL